MSRRTRSYPAGGEYSGESGIQNERILVLVFGVINWDPHVVCVAACVSRKLRAVARRVLWRELCISRAPRMAWALMSGSPEGRVCGGFHALAKLLFFCCGSEPSRGSGGHFMRESRFSKTSGKSFLVRKCWGDLLYVSDPCEHSMGPTEDDVGVYRGVFRAFMKSKTRACLIKRQVQLEHRVRCPYCGARVWSMRTARLVPRSASRRLGSHDGTLEYFVCVNGHLHGSCWLVPLSSDEDDDVALCGRSNGSYVSD
ncbi:EID1-like 3 [Tasmannia lanceolata]|uniref:EID1-like 3 n=1 Tax=Tasmannia lanceolata TaxID=3420 RepID=UPI0040644CD2